MKRQISVFAIFVLVCFSSSCTQIKKKTWKNEDIVSPKYEQFGKLVDEYLVNKNFRGTVLIGKKNEIIFAKGYGTVNKKDKSAQPINLNTTFEAGSITKQITAAAVMQLVQAKKINLDDKISKYFPEYVHGDEITVRMLLNMRSGLIDHINSPDEFFPRKVRNNLEKEMYANNPLPDDLVMKYFYEAPLLTKPDSTYFYCNTNYYLLAKIIEQVSEMSYQEYIQKNIFNKCGMKNSNLEFQKTDTCGYDYKGRYYSIPAVMAEGCGDLNTNATDLFKWNLQFTSGKVITKKSFNQIIDTESYGFGVYRRDNVIFHSGTTSVFNSYNMYNLEEKLSIIVLTNSPINEINATFVAGDIQKLWQNKDK